MRALGWGILGWEGWPSKLKGWLGKRASHHGLVASWLVMCFSLSLSSLSLHRPLSFFLLTSIALGRSFSLPPLRSCFFRLDSLTGEHYHHDHLSYEKACVLFNAASLASQSALEEISHQGETGRRTASQPSLQAVQEGTQCKLAADYKKCLINCPKTKRLRLHKAKLIYVLSTHLKTINHTQQSVGYWW